MKRTEPSETRRLAAAAANDLTVLTLNTPLLARLETSTKFTALPWDLTLALNPPSRGAGVAPLASAARWSCSAVPLGSAGVPDGFLIR